MYSYLYYSSKKKKKKKVNFKKPKNNKINYCKYVKKKNVMLFIEWIQALERFVSGFIELTVHSPVLLRVSLCLGKRTCSVVVALPSVSPPPPHTHTFLPTKWTAWGRTRGGKRTRLTRCFRYRSVWILGWTKKRYAYWCN